MTPKQKYKLAIKILDQERRRRYAVGANTYDKHGEGVFEFADNAKRKYVQLTEVIEFIKEKVKLLEEGQVEMWVEYKGKAKPFIPRDYRREIEE